MQAPLPLAVHSNPHYLRLGGRPAVQQLVAAFYQAMDTRPDARQIRAMHAPDLSDTQALLVAYLSEWLGGPKDYSPLRGPPRLRQRHAAFALDASAGAAWMACMQQALAQTCPDAALRTELAAAFQKVADALAGPHPHTHPHPHPHPQPQPQAHPPATATVFTTHPPLPPTGERHEPLDR